MPRPAFFFLSFKLREGEGDREDGVVSDNGDLDGIANRVDFNSEAEGGEVALGAGVYKYGVIFSAVGEAHGDTLGLADHVVVGDDITVGGKMTPLPAPVLMNCSIRPPNSTISVVIFTTESLTSAEMSATVKSPLVVLPVDTVRTVESLPLLNVVAAACCCCAS